MSQIPDFDLVIESLKSKLNIKTDIELAKILDMSRSNFSERKKRNSLPYENILKICFEKDLSLDEIFKNPQNTNKDNFSNNRNVNGSIIGNGNIYINTKDYNDESDIKEIIELLKLVPRSFLDKLKNRLKKIKEVMEGEF